ncbi:hypothetical protein AAFF_G00278810 [Aldrovandia affinis]|uniref:Uncharacterized protein n=1 Tax=Aldrovandia affinis TaxID=143900 RepID=A0AAD7WS70_9TELE|nr:hypothetical protein AAFF_G00278810 [Aldrovandia affinis]
MRWPRRRTVAPACPGTAPQGGLRGRQEALLPLEPRPLPSLHFHRQPNDFLSGYVSLAASRRKAPESAIFPSEDSQSIYPNIHHREIRGKERSTADTVLAKLSHGRRSLTDAWRSITEEPNKATSLISAFPGKRSLNLASAADDLSKLASRGRSALSLRAAVRREPRSHGETDSAQRGTSKGPSQRRCPLGSVRLQ